jgi:hypothetical protein
MNDDDIERAAIRAESGCATAAELQALETHAHKPDLRLVHDERNAIAVSTTLVRRFLGMADDEPTELSIFTWGRPGIALATNITEHVRLLRQAEKLEGFNGSYMLGNPINPAILARYDVNQIHRRAHNGRASDNDITSRRILYFDVDPERPKGISATDDERRAAYDVSRTVEEWLVKEIGTKRAVGHGCSGNGFFALVAIEPRPITIDDNKRIAKLLRLMHQKFGTDRVKLDCSVFNPARLMPCPGTMKRKGRHTDERPHRRASFTCSATVERIPMEVLA